MNKAVKNNEESPLSSGYCGIKKKKKKKLLILVVTHWWASWY